MRTGGQTNRAKKPRYLAKDFEILEELKSEIKPVVTLPTVEIKVENVNSITLIDSGSEIIGVSESFLRELTQKNVKIPGIPAKCTTLMGALGNKKARVREQVVALKSTLVLKLHSAIL